MSAPPARSAPPPPPPQQDEDRGASPNERLLSAAKFDNETLLADALTQLDDINGVDGLGNTALHYAVQNGSTNVLETILCHETCDVDLRNRLSGDTPLHIAVRNRWDDTPGLRLFLVASLLEAGADTKIRNKHNITPINLLPPAHASADPETDDEKIRAALRHAEAEALIADAGDVAGKYDSDGEVDPDDVASDSD